MTQAAWHLNGVRLGPERHPRLLVEELTIPQGVTAVLGESGAGKTSLLNCLVGFERPDAGTITSSGEARHQLAWVPADGGLWPHLTAREHLTAVLPDASANSLDPDQLLDRFDLKDLADRTPRFLSMGERSRLSVARALAAQSSRLVMDEPLEHVGESRLSRYWSAIRECRDANPIMVFATHSWQIVLREAEHVICMADGRALWNGPVRELYERPDSSELATLLGPANWFEPDEAETWLGQETSSAICLRPEKLVVQQDEGRFEVENSISSGSCAEVLLRDPDSKRQRTIWHTVRDEPIPPGTRVSLRAVLTAVVLMLLTCTGCTYKEDGGPALSIEDSRQFSLPVEGAMLPAPRGMMYGPDNALYVLDNAGRIVIYDQNGSLRDQWWMPEYSVGKPEGSHLLKDSRLAVADTHYHRVLFFDEQGTVVGSLGSHGTGPGEFIYTVDVAEDDDGSLYVAEYGGNDRVQKFDREGNFLLQFGKPGSGPGEFQRLSGLVWNDGMVYVADAINNRVQAFRDDGTFEKVVADSSTVGLHYPYDIAIAPDKSLYVAEYGAGRISRFTIEGELLGQYGEPGRGPGQLWTPWGVTVSHDGRVAIGDTGNRRVVELSL